MPPAPCPERLQKRLSRLNQENSVEAQHIRGILRAIQSKSAEPYSVKLPSTITVDLTDFSVRIHNELTDALKAFDPPELIHRIKECPVCPDLYWAGREDKAACDKHVDRWRQRKYRDEKRKRERAAADQQRRDEATEILRALSKAKRAVIRAIMGKDASDFYEIDVAVWHEYNDAGILPRSKLVIRRSTHRLYRDGYLEYRESADRLESTDRRTRRKVSPYDRYTPTRKLIDLWADADTREPD